MMRFVFALFALLFTFPALATNYTRNIVTDFGAVCAPRATSIDVATSTFTSANHGMPNGRVVRFTTTANGITAGTLYYTLNVSTNTFQVKTTSGGSIPLALSGTAIDTQTFSSDDGFAFSAFNTWAKTVTSATNFITLTIPSGGLCMFASYTGTQMFSGLYNITLEGNGATLDSSSSPYAASFVTAATPQNNLSSVRLNDVAQGATSVVAMDPTKLTTANGFIVGNYALISGIDLQGNGYPINNAFFDWVKVTGINTSTGQITFDRPTKHLYKSTWPHYVDGNSSTIPNQGGYAMLTMVSGQYNGQTVINNINVKQPAYSSLSGGVITLNNVSILKNPAVSSVHNCFSVTTALLVTYNNVNEQYCSGAEADKMVDSWVINNSTEGSIVFMSSPFNNFEINNSTVNGLAGTPRTTKITNSTINSVQVGPSYSGSAAFGAAETLYCENSKIYSLTTTTTGYAITSGGVVKPGLSINAGVITIAKTAAFPNFAVPGANLMWLNPAIPNSGAFHILDTWDDATNTYIKTDLTISAFPTPSTGSQLQLKPHPMPSATFRNCTGSDAVLELSKAPPSVPVQSYMNRTFTADRAFKTYGGTGFYSTLWGTLTKINVNVIKPYTGSGSFISRPLSTGGWQFGNVAGSVTTSNPVVFNPAIDAKTAGLRRLYPFPPTPLGTDSIPSALSISPPFTFANVVGGMMFQAGNVPTTMLPIIQLEVQTNQNVIMSGY